MLHDLIEVVSQAKFKGDCPAIVSISDDLAADFISIMLPGHAASLLNRNLLVLCLDLKRVD